MKVVYNNCFDGEFFVSKTALELYNHLRVEQGLEPVKVIDGSLKETRKDQILVQVVETLGVKASCYGSCLTVTEIPDEYAECFKIDEKEGNETIVCDPNNLVAYKLKDLNVSSLSDAQCRTKLEEVVKILNE